MQIIRKKIVLTCFSPVSLSCVLRVIGKDNVKNIIRAKRLRCKIKYWQNNYINYLNCLM